ncbi:hypothetical protein ANN_26610 [Periplaneta americana]|uniref:Transposase Tc1-like domain-containing protein n=1 Tax=Periplaneta americana TaxID=6978 RepID=A0ABQ8RYQ4_PERAM|nr:hypothetical protein ANN_26610 [Periplaneta americana]
MAVDIGNIRQHQDTKGNIEGGGFGPVLWIEFGVAQWSERLNIPRRSRESFLNEREKRFIVNKVKVNPRVTAPEIVQMLQQASGKKVSSQNVRRVLWQHGYRGRIPRKRPYVSKKNRAARLAFAKEHQDKPQTFWNTVIWTDETKINLFGSDGIQMVWRKANTAVNVDNTLPTVKHGVPTVPVPKKYYVPNNSSEITVTSGDESESLSRSNERVTQTVVGSSEQAPTFRLLSRSRNIPCATRYCEPATAGQVSSSESEHCYFGTGGSDLLFIFATVPRESEHTLCHAVLRARNSWQVSSSESEHCYFGTGGSDLLFIFATVPRPEQFQNNCCVIFYPSLVPSTRG